MKARLKRKKRQARLQRQRWRRELGREHRLDWWTLWGAGLVASTKEAALLC